VPPWRWKPALALGATAFCCVTIGMQGEKEDSLAVNRWTLPRRRPRRSRVRFPRAALVIVGLIAFVCCGVGAPCARADEAANEAARELGRKLATQIDVKQTRFQIDLSDATKESSFKEVMEMMEAFRSTFLPAGYRPPAASFASVRISITLTKNVTQRLLIARYEKDGTTVVEIVSLSLADAASGAGVTYSVRIETQIEFVQAAPLLDFAVLSRQDDSPSEVLALGIGNIALMNQANGRWQVKDSLEIPESAPVARDVRGRLVVTGDTFETGVGGTFCRGTVSPEFKMNCDPKAGKWVFKLIGGDSLHQNPIPGSNRFLAGVIPYPSPREIFAEASGRIGTLEFRVTADSEGRTWLSTGGKGPETIDSAWGDEFATLEQCVDRAAFLAAGRGDFSTPDFLQVVGNLENGITETSPVFNLPGPVMALWSESPGSPVRAVVHNLKTGLYEAHQITLSCVH
jgi:hypothetical protein